MRLGRSTLVYVHGRSDSIYSPLLKIVCEIMVGGEWCSGAFHVKDEFGVIDCFLVALVQLVRGGVVDADSDMFVLADILQEIDGEIVD